MQVYRSDAAQALAHGFYQQLLDRWPVPNEQRRIPTSEGDTFVVTCGPKSAPPIVLLHGTMATTAMWMDEVTNWATDFRVYALDIIGDAGYSAPSRHSLASDAHARWLNEVLDALGLTTVSLAGISLGAGIALDFAIRNPSRVSGLVVMCPAGVADRNILLWALPLLLLGKWGANKVTARILGPVTPPVSERNELMTAFTDAIFKGMRPRTEKIPTFSDAQLQSLHMPLLVLLGENDVTMDAAAIERRLQQHASNCEVKMIAAAGHYLGDQSAPIREFLQHLLLATGQRNSDDA